MHNVDDVLVVAPGNFSRMLNYSDQNLSVVIICVPTLGILWEYRSVGAGIP
jgi:hypothetical protein